MHAICDSHIERPGREEERVAARLRALLRERLEVEELADRHSPQPIAGAPKYQRAAMATRKRGARTRAGSGGDAGPLQGQANAA